MFRFPRLMPLTRGLLIATAVSFVLHAVVQVWVRSPWGLILALQTHAASPWTALQVVTHPLAWRIGPGSPVSLLMQLVFTWWAVSPFEERYGARATAQLLSFATVAAGVLAALAGLVSPPDIVAGPGTWMLAGWAALGWSLRHATLDFAGLQVRGVAYLWAALIMGLTLLGMATALVGLIVVMPWLGHASWHAYRALVDASRLTERLPPVEVA